MGGGTLVREESDGVVAKVIGKISSQLSFMAIIRHLLEGEFITRFTVLQLRWCRCRICLVGGHVFEIL